MQAHPYMFLLTTIDSTLIPILQCQTLTPVLNPPPITVSSTSQQNQTIENGQDLMYPLAFTSLTLAYNCGQSSEEPFYNPPTHNIQKNQPATQASPSFNIPTTPTPLSYNSECSIKLEESPSLISPNLGSSCKKKNSLKLRQKGQNPDREYNPNKPQRHTTRKRLHQNQNRNVIPNEINQILSFIQKQNKSGHLLARLFQKFPPQQGQNYNITRFYLYQGLLKEKVSHYTNQRSLRLINELHEPECRIWSSNEQRYYNKLCRLLVRHFLLEDSVFIILTSKRMKREKKIDHLRARREVAEKVMEILREG